MQFQNYNTFATNCKNCWYSLLVFHLMVGTWFDLGWLHMKMVYLQMIADLNTNQAWCNVSTSLILHNSDTTRPSYYYIIIVSWFMTWHLTIQLLFLQPFCKISNWQCKLLWVNFSRISVYRAHHYQYLKCFVFIITITANNKGISFDIQQHIRC